MGLLERDTGPAESSEDPTLDSSLISKPRAQSLQQTKHPRAKMSYGGGYGGGRGGGDKMSALGAGLKNQTWDISALPKFEETFSKEDPAVPSRSEAEVDQFRRDN